MYYADSEITRPDKQSRRLFLSSEFRQKSGRHSIHSNLSYANPKRLQQSGVFIIDDDVLDEYEKNVALPKTAFADHVLNRTDGFNDFDIAEIGKIFQIIVGIALA